MDGDFTLMQQMREQKLSTTEAVPIIIDGDSVKYGSNESGPAENGQSEDAEAGAPAVAAESEQATYASANNDLKGTKAYNNADVAGLYTLAMAIIDFRGHRVVAQVFRTRSLH